MVTCAGTSSESFVGASVWLKNYIKQKCQVNFKFSIHGIRTSKNGGDFIANFQKKPWAIVQGNFQILAYFLKWS